MRILIIHNYPSVIEVRNSAYNSQEVGLARAMVRRGHTCDLLLWGEKDETLTIPLEKGGKITVYYRTGKDISRNALFYDISDLVERYDVLQPCEYSQILSWQLAKKYPQKTVIFHGPYYPAFNRRYNIFCHLFDIFCLKSYKKLNTPFITKSHLAQRSLNAKGLFHVKTIGVGIDLEALSQTNETTPRFIEEIERRPDIINLLYIGRFEPRKNTLFLYEVAHRLKEKGEKIRLILVGKGDAGYVDKCEKKAHALGLEGDIIRVERLEQKFLSKLYEKCDFFLLPTLYEIFGMVLLEAMYYRLCCLTTENGGSDMLVRQGENGFVLPLEADKWAETILQNKGNRGIGETAHKDILRNFTWDALAGQFETAYASVSRQIPLQGTLETKQETKSI